MCCLTSPRPSLFSLEIIRAAGVYTALKRLLDLALARVEGRTSTAAACVWPSVAVPCAVAAAVPDNMAEELAKLELAADVYASVLPVMGLRAGRVVDMLLTALTAADLRAALDVEGELLAHAQRLASLLP